MSRMHFHWALLAVASVMISTLAGCNSTGQNSTSNSGYWPDHARQDNTADRILADIRGNRSGELLTAAPVGGNPTAIDPPIIDAGATAGPPVIFDPAPPPTLIPTPPKIFEPSPPPTVIADPAPPVVQLAPQPIGAKIYIVKKGDSFWVIARRHYGKGSKWKTIANANPNVNPKKLRLGQKLVIPQLASATGANAPAAGSNRAAAVDDDARFK